MANGIGLSQDRPRKVPQSPFEGRSQRGADQIAKERTCRMFWPKEKSKTFVLNIELLLLLPTKITA